MAWGSAKGQRSSAAAAPMAPVDVEVATREHDVPTPPSSAVEPRPALPSPPGWWRVGQAIVLALPSLVLLERAWSRRWMTDDGFINLRMARMIVEGHGPVFNVGERVEATTSALWVWLVAAGDLVLPLDMEWVAVLFGIVGAVGGLALATFGAARLHRCRWPGAVLVPAGALVVAAVTPFWDFATSGLEGGLTFGWLGLCGWLVARWASGQARFGFGSAAVVGLGPLVRPDLAVVPALVLGGVLWAQWRDDRGGDRLRLVGAAVAMPVAYQVFRMGFYATLVPNTALAKSGGRSRWDVGYAYLRDMVAPYWLLVPLACLLVGALVPLVVRSGRARDRRGMVALTVLPAAGLVNGIYVVRVGGDYMHGRLLLPALFALVVPVAAIPVPAQRSSRRVLTLERALTGCAAAAVTVWAVVALVNLRPTPVPTVRHLFSSDAHFGHARTYGAHAVTAEDHGIVPGSPLLPEPDVSVFIDGPVTGGQVRPDGRHIFGAYGIGLIGYTLGPDAYVLDLLGLADPLVSRFELEQPGTTGHEKPIPAPWLAARVAAGPVDPDRFPAPPLVIPLYESPPGQFDRDTDAARRALRCGELAELDEAVGEPLTVGRFVSNLIDAARLTRSAVTPDPVEAEKRFCD